MSAAPGGPGGRAVLSVMGESIDFAGLKEALEAFGGSSEEGLTAELEDEGDPDGNVLVRRADGTLKAVMPREVWDQLIEWKKD